MPKIGYETPLPKPHEVERKWYVVDAAGKRLGRLASEIAKILVGKHKPIYTPHVDVGDFVIVVNAEKVVLTGKKLKKKIYYRHSGYVGGLKMETAEQLLKRRPERLIWLAVYGMLPKNRHRKNRIKRLKIYAGPEHPHTAQRPIPLKIDTTP